MLTIAITGDRVQNNANFFLICAPFVTLWRILVVNDINKNLSNQFVGARRQSDVAPVSLLSYVTRLLLAFHNVNDAAHITHHSHILVRHVCAVMIDVQISKRHPRN